jgi:ABC-2 type transport system permease protein
MKILSITLKDLQVLVKDRGALFLLFLLPFVFIVLLAWISQASSASQTNETARIPLTVVNGDPEGALTQEYLAALENTGKVEISFEDPAKVEEQMTNAVLRWAAYIPSDFSANLAAGGQTSLRLVLHPLSDEKKVMTVERALVSAARATMMMRYLNQGLEQMAAMQAANPEAEQVFSQEHTQQQIQTQQEQAAGRPLITVVETVPAAVNKEREEKANLPQIGQVTVLGMAVLFAFLGAQNTAMSIFKEKKVGSFRRLMAAPLSKVALLTGKLLPNLILNLGQIAVILFTGGLVIQWIGLEPLDFSSDPLGLALIALVMSLCSTSLGIFLAAIAKTENQVGGLGSVILFVAGLLGGSFIPMFLMPEGLQTVARAIPHFWANQALYGLVFRGQTLADLGFDILVLLAFTLAFFGFGLWKFKFD